MAKRSAPASSIRNWARESGKEVGQRGRLSKGLQDEFYKSHTPSGKPKG